MKTYRVHLGDKRSLAIQADSYQEVGEQYLFFADGRPIPDIFVLASTVVSITVDPDTPPRIFPATDETGYD